jgi:hypothetical protein
MLLRERQVIVRLSMMHRLRRLDWRQLGQELEQRRILHTQPNNNQQFVSSTLNASSEQTHCPGSRPCLRHIVEFNCCADPSVPNFSPQWHCCAYSDTTTTEAQPSTTPTTASFHRPRKTPPELASRDHIVHSLVPRVLEGKDATGVAQSL